MSIVPGYGDLTPEEMQAHENQCRIRDKAIRWITDHQKEIEDLAGHESTSLEKAVAQVAIMVELSGAMYTGTRKEFGHPGAQDALRTAVGLIGKVLRRNGEAVRMISKVEFESLSAAPGGPDVSAAVAPPGICECTLDQDGHCQSCIKMLEKFNSAMSLSITIMMEAAQSGKVGCSTCVRREMDSVLARFVRNDLSKVPPEMAEGIMKTLFATSQSMQSMKMPLTTRAWDELIKER